MITTQPNAESHVGQAPHVVLPRPRPATYKLRWSLALFSSDLLGVGLAVLAAESLFHVSFAGIVAWPGALATVAIAIVTWQLIFERIGMYRRSFSVNARDEVYASVAGSAMAIAPALLLFLISPDVMPYRHSLVAALLLSVVCIGGMRFAVHVMRARVVPRSARRIAVVGSPERVLAVPFELSLTASDSIVRLPIEAFEDDVAEIARNGDVEDLDWLQTAFERGCDEIIITEALPAELMPSLLRLTESHGVKVAFAPLRIRPHACDFSVRRDGGLALLYPRSLAICTPGAEAFRRALDLLIAVPAAILLAPLFVVVALAVTLDSGAPVLYRQTRVGRLGTSFVILKFRTMQLDAESDSGPVWAQLGESRTTRIGRFLRRTSLDELPQLFNVIRGEMSVVGPRPERPFYVEQFRKMLPRYDERHLVRPGITGWSHVNMRRNVDTSAIGERLSYDLFYLEHWSVFMDILIICKTAAEFLFHAAA